MTNQPKESKSGEDRSKVPIVSLRDLEYRLGEDREALRALANNWREEYHPFKQMKPPKPFQRELRARKTRDIDNPSEALKSVQKKILDRLLHPVKLPHFLFGGVSPFTVNEHAAQHLGHGTVVKMDIKSYYPNVTNRHVYIVWRQVLKYSPAISGLLTRLTTYGWHLPQGAPTSPALANLFLASIYSPVLEACAVKDITPTAWVDDLIFSGKEARSVMELVRQTLAAKGFKLSSKKRVILGGRDAKIITGIRLGAGRIRAPKDKVRDVRAAIHKLEINHIQEHEKPKYLVRLRGRLNHIDCICAADAAPLKRQLEQTLGKGSRRKHESIKMVGKARGARTVGGPPIDSGDKRKQKRNCSPFIAAVSR